MLRFVLGVIRKARLLGRRRRGGGEGVLEGAEGPSPTSSVLRTPSSTSIEVSPASAASCCLTVNSSHFQC